MATKDSELGPNTPVRLGVVVSCGVAIATSLVTGVTLAVNANAKITTLQVTISTQAERQIRMEQKIDRLIDEGSAFNSRLASLEVQMRMVQSAQPK